MVPLQKFKITKNFQLHLKLNNNQLLNLSQILYQLHYLRYTILFQRTLNYSTQKRLLDKALVCIHSHKLPLTAEGDCPS